MSKWLVIGAIIFFVSLLAGVLISWASKTGKINIPYLSSQKNTPPPQSTLVPAKTYSGILYKIDKKPDGGAWFTVLVEEDKTVKKLEIGPNVSVKMRSTKTGESDVPQEAKLSDLKVGQAITLTVGDKITDILEMGPTQFAFIEGAVYPLSDKMLIIDWYNNKIAVSMGNSIQLSHKFDTVNGKMLPGKRINVSNFSSLTKGQFVFAAIDRATQSSELIIKSVAIVNDK